MYGSRKLETLSSAFSDRCGLTSVDLPSSLTSIDDAAFDQCTSLGSVSALPEGLSSIGHRAFYMCPLTSISLPSTLTFIGRYAFSRTHLSSFALPDGFTTFGEGWLCQCGSLVSVSLPSSLTSIGEYAFSESSLPHRSPYLKASPRSTNAHSGSARP